MYGVNVRMTRLRGCDPSGVFGKYRVAFSSTLSRIGIFTPQRKSYSAEAGGDSFGKGEDSGAGVWAKVRMPAVKHKVRVKINNPEIIGARERFRSFIWRN